MLRRTSLSLPLVLLLVMILPAGAEQPTASPPAAVTDPAQAGPDFAVQGDWVGTAPYKGKDVKYGVQIIALGDGKFHGVGYYGGLPGDGWDTKTKLEADGQTQDGVTVFKRNDSTSTYKDGEVTIRNNEGKVLCIFHKVQRTSPTLGAKPPAGAVVLFDGTSADKFADGRMTADGLLMEGATEQAEVPELHDPPGVPHPVRADEAGPGARQQRLLRPGALRSADPRLLRTGAEHE